MDGGLSSLRALPRPGLVERADGLAAVEQALADGRNGMGSALFLVAEAGVGKSAMLDAARTLATPGTAVRAVHGASMERDLAFSYIDQFLADDPGPGEQDDPLVRRRSVHDLARRQLRRWAHSGPLLVLLDDLQWSDRDSLDVIGFLARRLSALPIVLLGALRPWPLDAFQRVELLERDDAARVLPLHPLSRAASDELLARLLDTDEPDAELADRAWSLARGNPLLVEHAARVATEEGDLPAGPTYGPRRRQLRQTVLLSHLAGMSAESVECARAAAVLGTRARLAVVEAIAGTPDGTFTASFDALAASGVLHDDGAGTVRFSHDVLAAAIYEDMAPARRRELHRLAFLHYVALGDAASAAPHALAADLEGDERALTAVAEAARLALLDGATETAIAQLDAAARLAGRTPPVWLLVRQADTLFAVGRPTAAIEIYRALLGRPLTPDERLEIETKAARATTYTGRLDEALAAYDRLLEIAPDDGTLAVERAHVVWELAGPAAALEALGPERVDDGMVGLVRSFFALESGDPAALDVIFGRTASNRIDPDTALRSFNVALLQVTAYAFTERYDEALKLIDDAVGAMLAAGAPRATLPLRLSRLGIHLFRGELAEVLSGADELTEAVGLDGITLPNLQVFRGTALAWLGRRDEAWAACRDGDTVRPLFARLGLQSLRGRLLLEEQRFAEAADVFDQLHGAVVEHGFGQPFYPKWAAAAVEAALAAGRPEQAERVADWLAGCDATFAGHWEKLIELGARAGCAADRGADGEADALYQQALALPCALPLDRAVIALRYGRWLRRQRQVLRARPVLADALHVAEQCGAVPLADSAHAELSASGGRRRAGGPAGQLTAQERRVVTLAAAGATTREIADTLRVSAHTVETHLTHAYLKLGVRSKRELRAISPDSLDVALA